MINFGEIQSSFLVSPLFAHLPVLLQSLQSVLSSCFLQPWYNVIFNVMIHPAVAVVSFFVHEWVLTEMFHFVINPYCGVTANVA